MQICSRLCLCTFFCIVDLCYVLSQGVVIEVVLNRTQIDLHVL